MLAFLAARRFTLRLCLTLGALAALIASAATAQAQIGSDRYSSIVIDANSGNILSAANPDELRFPASLTKMMTLYLVFEAIRDRRISLNDYVPVSPNAAAMSPTKLGLMPGTLITVEQAILGLVTKSANDAAAALGEMLGGDEDRFAQMMTLRAHALGMTRTTFRNASGLPDWNQVTTAHDIAVLARHLVQDFPGFYHYFSTPQFVFAGRIIRNHQHLLISYPGADGLKTGYTDAAGFNVVTSAVRGDTRLIGVVIGAGSGGERDAHMAALLDQGFDRLGVASLVVARREPSYHVPSFISLAHAAPPSPMVAVVHPQFRPSFDRPTAVYSRRASAFRSERAPGYSVAAPRISQPAHTSQFTRMSQPQIHPAGIPLQAVRSGNATRTAHGGTYGRFPG